MQAGGSSVKVRLAVSSNIACGHPLCLHRDQNSPIAKILKYPYDRGPANRLLLLLLTAGGVV